MNQLFAELETTSKRIAALSAKGTFSSLFDSKTLSSLSKNLKKIQLLIEASRRPQMNQYVNEESRVTFRSRAVKVLVQVEHSLISLIAFSPPSQINIIDSVRYQLASLESTFCLTFEADYLKKCHQTRSSHRRLNSPRCQETITSFGTGPPCNHEASAVERSQIPLRSWPYRSPLSLATSDISACRKAGVSCWAAPLEASIFIERDQRIERQHRAKSKKQRSIER